MNICVSYLLPHSLSVQVLGRSLLISSAQIPTISISEGHSITSPSNRDVLETTIPITGTKHHSREHKYSGIFGGLSRHWIKFNCSIKANLREKEC